MDKKMIRMVMGLAFYCLAHITYAQNNVGINTDSPNARAVLQLVSPTNDQGFMVPGLTTAQRTDSGFVARLSSSENSLLVFDTDLGAFFYWMNNNWEVISTQELEAGTGLAIVGNTISNIGDLDAANEIQDLSLTDNILSITLNGSASQIDLSTYLDNTDNQTLTLSGASLSISGGNTVDFSDLQDGIGTDDQALSLTDNLLSLEDGGSVDLSGYLDNTDAQTLSLSTEMLSISGGNAVDLSVLKDGIGTDDQSLSLTDNLLSLENGGSVDLSAYLDNTDAQSLSDVLSNGNDAGSSQITNLGDPSANQDAATKAYVDTQLSSLNINDSDSDPANELQDLVLTGNTLTITGLTSPTAIDLSPFAGTNTDNQTLSFTSTTLSIVGGNSVDLASLQDGTGTDNQTIDVLSLNTGVLSISLSGDGQPTQTLDLNSLKDGIGTDDQGLSLTNDQLTLEDGGTVDLSGYMDNTDNQTLSFSSTTLSITGGNSVDLASLQDGTGTDNQTIDELSLNTGVLSISLSGDGQPAQTLDLNSLKDGIGTDDQGLSLTNDQLTLEDGGTVDLSGYMDNTDNQTLSFTSTTLSITGGNSVNLASLRDGIGTDDQIASEVPVTAGNGMTSTNVQSALAEHQSDINSVNSSISTLNNRVTNLEATTTDYFYLTATDFLPLYSVNGTDARYNENQVFIIANEAGSTGKLKAILELPDRATITTVEAFGENSANTSQSSTLTLYSVAFGDNKVTPTSLGSASLVANSGSFQPINFGVDKQVDNSANMYYLIFQGQAGVSTPYASLYYVKVTYTY